MSLCVRLCSGRPNREFAKPNRAEPKRHIVPDSHISHTNMLYAHNYVLKTKSKNSRKNFSEIEPNRWSVDHYTIGITRPHRTDRHSHKMQFTFGNFVAPNRKYFTIYRPFK
jgi:hypothetical protein